MEETRGYWDFEDVTIKWSRGQWHRCTWNLPSPTLFLHRTDFPSSPLDVLQFLPDGNPAVMNWSFPTISHSAISIAFQQSRLPPQNCVDYSTINKKVRGQSYKAPANRNIRTRKQWLNELNRVINFVYAETIFEPKSSFGWIRNNDKADHISASYYHFGLFSVLSNKCTTYLSTSSEAFFESIANLNINNLQTKVHDWLAMRRCSVNANTSGLLWVCNRLNWSGNVDKRGERTVASVDLCLATQNCSCNWRLVRFRKVNTLLNKINF